MARGSARKGRRRQLLAGFDRPPLWGSIALGVSIALFAGLLVLVGQRAPDDVPVASPPVASGPTSSPTAPPTADPGTVIRPTPIERVLALGDGITAGQGASAPGAGYVTLAQTTLLTRFSWNVLAFSGGTLGGVFDEAELPAETDAVLVELGTNDWEDTPAEEFAAAYRDRLVQLRDRYPEALVVCLGVWQSPDRPATVGYDTAVHTGCESARGRFVQLSDLYADPANHQSGRPDANPGDTGYRLIADRVVSALRGT